MPFEDYQKARRNIPGRPKRRSVTVRLTEPEFARLQALSTRYGKEMSQVLREALHFSAEYVNMYDEERAVIETKRAWELDRRLKKAANNV